MSLRFSDLGPEFPSALIDALMAGEVVFLCGTGVSAPQLPDFKSLVDQTYAQLGVAMDVSEKRSYDGQRFEEVLGALGRRLADPEAMVRTVSELLAVPADPLLDQHRTILRLSRDISNRVLIVTTNFDTLLERALGLPAPLIHSESFAGQSLPAPGGSGFSGIIHIHGRLVDPSLDLDPTPLVLTSADYGDAYMRSGWASRFLFDLARCKTIVLIGYSANDAPVRYFLNVLEADRARFPDLRPVYAFDAYDRDPVEAEAGWGTLAVTPLAYCKRNPATGVPDHSPLWGDLHQLADIIERPKRSREARARQILMGDSSALTDQLLSELSWLFTDRSDLWPVALDAIADPRWFRIFHENKLWSVQDASWVIPAWIARNFEDRQRFMIAVEWHTIFGRDFLSRLDQRLRQAPPASNFWLKAWRILISAGVMERSADFDENAYALKQKLESGLILDGELAQSVMLLEPSLVVRRRWQLHDEGEDETAADTVGAEASEPQLSNLVALDLHVIDEYGATEIIEALNALDGHAVRILELCSESLRSSLQQSVDLGMIVEDYDTSDYSVPSVEDHGQNEHHNGVLFLVRAIVNAFPKALATDRDRARAQAAQWRTWPGRMPATSRTATLRPETSCLTRPASRSSQTSESPRSAASCAQTARCATSPVRRSLPRRRTMGQGRWRAMCSRSLRCSAGRPRPSSLTHTRRSMPSSRPRASFRPPSALCCSSRCRQTPTSVRPSLRHSLTESTQSRQRRGRNAAVCRASFHSSRTRYNASAKSSTSASGARSRRRSSRTCRQSALSSPRLATPVRSVTRLATCGSTA